MFPSYNIHDIHHIKDQGSYTSFLQCVYCPGIALASNLQYQHPRSHPPQSYSRHPYTQTQYHPRPHPAPRKVAYSKFTSTCIQSSIRLLGEN